VHQHSLAADSPAASRYVSTAETHFERADSVLASLEGEARRLASRDVSIFRANHLLMKGGGGPGLALSELQALLQDAALTPHGEHAVSFASATAAMADGHLHLGRPHRATAAAKQAYGLRAKSHVRAARSAQQLPHPATSPSPIASSEDAEECIRTDSASSELDDSVSPDVGSPDIVEVSPDPWQLVGSEAPTSTDPAVGAAAAEGNAAEQDEPEVGAGFYGGIQVWERR